MEINPKIFKAYDVRGVYPNEINEDTFYLLGRIFAAYLEKIQGNFDKEKPIILVGRDVRPSSASLSESFIEGILDFGFDVWDAGQTTTPMLWFGIANLKTFGGVMITASHLSSEYNGVKLMKIGAQYVADKEIPELYKMMGLFRLDSRKRRGSCRKIEIAADYLDFLSKDFNVSRKFNVAIDAVGGAACKFLPEFLQKINISYSPLFFEADGTFSKHNPDPSLEISQQFVKEKIVETNADFGVIFDGDADRIAVIDEKSHFMKSGFVGGIIADGFLKEGDWLVYDLISTRAIRDYFGKKNINTKASRVGHPYIRKAMEETGADFALESNSGHYYFKSVHCIESAFFALRKILEALDKNYDSTISDLAEPFSEYAHSGVISFPMTAGKWKRIFEDLKKEHKKGKQSFEDGILVEYEDWWFNLRLSNTEPIVRLVLEAKNEELLEEKRKEILKKIAK